MRWKCCWTRGGRRGGHDGSGPNGDVFQYHVTLERRAVLQNATEERDKELEEERRRREVVEKERDAERAKRELVERQRQREAERLQREISELESRLVAAEREQREKDKEMERERAIERQQRLKQEQLQVTPLFAHASCEQPHEIFCAVSRMITLPLPCMRECTPEFCMTPSTHAHAQIGRAHV